MATTARPQALLVSNPALDEVPNLSQAARAQLSALAEVVELDMGSAAVTAERFFAELRQAHALFIAGWDTQIPFLNAERLAQAPLLSFIGCHQDNRWRFLDVDSARKRNIALVDGSTAMAGTVAECALSLMLCCLRSIPQRHNELVAGIWRENPDDRLGFVAGELSQRRVGIIGMGAIGLHLARLLEPFECTITATSNHLLPAQARELGITLLPLDELLASAEIVVVCAPPVRGRPQLLGRPQIRLLAHGSILILISRASVVNTEALIERVQANSLKVGLDVFDQEPPPSSHPLLGHQHVVHTPHIAGRTVRANHTVFRVTIDDFHRQLLGQPLRYETSVEHLLYYRGQIGAPVEG